MPHGLEERIRSRMAIREMSQRELARSVALDDAKMSKSLNGLRRFSSLELALVAQALETSVDWLLTGAEPKKWRFAARVADAAADATSVARPLVESLSEAHDGLAALGSAWSAPVLEQRGTTGSDGEQARAEAELAVDRLGRPIRDLDTPTLISVVEKALGINVVVTELPAACDGIAYEDGEFRVVVLAQSESAERQRWTLAHEVGHILAGDARDAIVEETIGGTIGAAKISEGRADSFAACFLMPRSEIDACLGARSAVSAFDELVWSFCVSPRAMAWRLFHEGMMTAGERDQLRGGTSRETASRLRSMAEFALRSQIACQPRAPWALVERYLDLHAEGLATLRPVAKLLGWDLEGTITFFARDDARDFSDGPLERL